MEPFLGSPDTKDKLSRLEQYLQQYSLALKEQKFARIYIDAFAGSGHRTEVRPALPLFGAEPEEVNTPGSARIALGINPPFHTVALIEEDPERAAQLEKLKDEFPDRKIVVRQGDANDWVKALCRNVPWHKKQASILGMRGVVFLDPFGMEVDWSTVEAIAETRALDCWYFFPLSGLYRNAPHDPRKLDASKEAALDRVLGTPTWRAEWYKSQTQRTMFETEAEATERADVDAIEAFVAQRLRTVFKGTVMEPVRLRHNGGAPMASLFFAVSNPSGPAVGLAQRIASYILKGSSSNVRPRS
ncbi:MAG: three-Cys-motif partner protein TcmP [Dehalococcoidia bacterium]